MRSPRTIAVLLLLSGVLSCAPSTVLTPMPNDQIAVRYRVEQRDTQSGVWEPVREGKSFKKNQQIRFRFMSNVSAYMGPSRKRRNDDPSLIWPS